MAHEGREDGVDGRRLVAQSRALVKEVPGLDGHLCGARAGSVAVDVLESVPVREADAKQRVSSARTPVPLQLDRKSVV